MNMKKTSLVVFVSLILIYPIYSTQFSLSNWIVLRSDATNIIRNLIRSEVYKQGRFSTTEEDRANMKAVEDEKDHEENAYREDIATLNREFKIAKKRRDDLTSQFQAASIAFEEQQKNFNTIKEGIGSLDSQITRDNQDITIQQESLKKWLKTEKQGEALVAVIYNRGFIDNLHTLDDAADKESAPLMAQYMGTYIQSYSKVIDSVLSVDFIRAIEEGTAKWNNEEPLRVELGKGNRGTTYLRIKRYELILFQAPNTGQIKHGTQVKNVRATIISSNKELNDFLIQNDYLPSNYELGKAKILIHEVAQANATAESDLREQVKSFHERIISLKERIRVALSDKDTQLSLLKRKEEQFRKAAQEKDSLLLQKDEAERIFHAAQRALHDKRRVRETIIIKAALAKARGSQTPADASAEAIIDILAEVKNDAKIQHSTSTTEVTNFQVTAESVARATTEAQITSARLISFVNEGDSVRVKVAFRIRTVLGESAEETPTATSATPQKLFVSKPTRDIKNDKEQKYYEKVEKKVDNLNINDTVLVGSFKKNNAELSLKTYIQLDAIIKRINSLVGNEGDAVNL
jgi:hypothetical protein